MKLRLFQSFGTNFYCTHLWWSYSRETLRKTTVAYNNTLRFMMADFVAPVECLYNVILAILRLLEEGIFMALNVDCRNLTILL